MKNQQIVSLPFEREYLVSNGVFAKESVFPFENCRAVYRDWQIHGPMVLPRRSSEGLLKMQFELQGGSVFRNEVPGPDVVIGAGRHNLLFFPQLNGSLYYQHSRKSLDIILSPAYLYAFAQNDPLGSTASFLRAVRLQQPALLSKQSLPITSSMAQVIEQILSCPYQGKLRENFIKAQVMILLTLQIDQFNHQDEKTTAFRLSDKDMFQLEQLREQILEDPGRNFRLQELAAQAGMSDFKLKRAFKQHYGTTVFTFIHSTRMNRSRLMLEKGNMQIKEIAYEMGYKHPQHFTKAFKDTFGYLPGHSKTQQSLYS